MSTIYSRRDQEMILVLYALSDLGGIRTRQEVIDHISRSQWYQIIREDLTPTRTSREARYRINLAWARKDCALKEWINNFESNSWELNREGRKFLDRALKAFRSGKLNLGRCEFFTLNFKRTLVPRFEPSAEDRKRISPAALLEELEKQFG